ncbi:MAG: ATP-binding protein [Candidatus Omnitrophota bacterium]
MTNLRSELYYKNLAFKTVIRLIVTYLIPLIVLTIYFHLQYRALIRESRLHHLQSIAEYQANILDLFLRERIANLAELIDDPKLEIPPSSDALKNSLEKLKNASDAFEDIGFFDPAGLQIAYSGPYPQLEKKNYASEPWYISLREKKERFIITDIYLGFRQTPHFTLAVSRTIDGQYCVLKTTLIPAKIYEYLATIQDANGAFVSIVNQNGYYQMVKPRLGTLLDSSAILPPTAPRNGTKEVWMNGRLVPYGYSWLRIANWTLIVQTDDSGSQAHLGGTYWGMLLVSLAVILLLIVVILIRGWHLVQFQKEVDQTKAQLEHASKLASLGELAAGIAHEINNPLAIVAEEAGLMKDLMNPQFGEEASQEEMLSHLDEIRQAAFRCRDITRKLLSFARKSDFHPEACNLHALIDDVADGLLGNELALSGIEFVRNYRLEDPFLFLDGNQLRQVLLNLLKNAIDAIKPPGTIAVETSLEDKEVHLKISDTGKGIPPEAIDKIFLPFFTTKDVGKGTGLGLSVSFGIVKNMGGSLQVQSELGKGSTFIVALPMRKSELEG